MQAVPSSVFVTGATGFIGRRLAALLQQQGYRVRAMIRPEKANDKRVPEGCEQVPVGLTDVAKLSTAIAGCSAVVYCAGSVRGRKPEDFSMANIEGVRAVLDAIERSADTQDATPPLLLFSSLAASRPQISDYAFSKNAAEQLLHDRPQLGWTIFRPPAVYGPGDREMLPVLKMVRRGLLAHAGPRDQRLSLLHVDDLAAAALSWLTATQACNHKTYAIDDGTAGGYDWRAIGEAVNGRAPLMLRIPRVLLDIPARANLLLSSLLGYSPMLTPGKVRELVQADWLCDNSEYCTDSGWQPRIDLEQGAAQLFGTGSAS